MPSKKPRKGNPAQWKTYYQANRTALLEKRRAYGERPGIKDRYNARARKLRAERREAGDPRYLAKLERERVSGRRRLAVIREEVRAAYGGKCRCCGEGTTEFLTIDHINGGGRRHRAELRKAGTWFYRYLKNQGWPKEYQLLCMNCNWAKGAYGRCPHEVNP